MSSLFKPFQDAVQMIQRDYWSWWFRPPFLKNGKKKKVLFAGPWVGEFGWELLNWQGFVRKISRDYDRIIVSCRKGNEGLYSDFCSEFVFHEVSGTAECNVAHDITNPSEYDRIIKMVPEDADHLNPMGFQPLERQEFVKLGQIDDSKKFDIIIHPRGRNFGTVRNWDREKWEQLIERCTSAGFSIACIGLTNATLDIDSSLGFQDFRDVSLSETLDLFASSKLVVGPSSGPMHLASLCGTSHLVWTDTNKHARGRTNRDKYEWWWNPHNTPVTVLDSEGFDPSVETVYSALVTLL